MTANRRMSVSYGLICLLLGAIWLLHTMELLPWRVSDYVFSWRFLLVVLGFLAMAKNNRSVLGLLLLTLGALSSATYFWHLPDGWATYIPPVALLAVGSVLILRPNPDRPRFDSSDENVLNRATIFGSFNHKVTSVLFKGGNLTVIFGSNKVDFSKAHLGDETVRLHIINIFGSAMLAVPDSWDVSLDTVNILGSTEEKRFVSDAVVAKEGTLVVTGVCLFGSLLVKG